MLSKLALRTTPRRHPVNYCCGTLLWLPVGSVCVWLCVAVCVFDMFVF